MTCAYKRALRRYLGLALIRKHFAVVAQGHMSYAKNAYMMPYSDVIFTVAWGYARSSGLKVFYDL